MGWEGGAQPSKACHGLAERSPNRRERGGRPVSGLRFEVFRLENLNIHGCLVPFLELLKLLLRVFKCQKLRV